jgi:hypothetical protein
MRIKYNTRWPGLEKNAQANLSAEEDTEKKKARLSCSYGYSGRMSGSETKTAERTLSAYGIGQLLRWNVQGEESQEELPVRHGLQSG